MSTTDAYPTSYLFHNNGGFIYRSNGVPTRRQEGKPSRFRIIPVIKDNDGNDQVVELSTEFSTQADYIRTLISWKQVVIQDEHGSFLHCGTYLPSKSAQAWYAKEITPSTVLELKFCPNTSTFSFKSYNKLYLHYNSTLGTIAFKTRTPDEASWYIHTLNLAASYTEEILVVGVVNKQKEFILQRTADGISRDWRKGFEEIIDKMFDDLKVEEESEGSGTMFQHPDTLHQWCVTRSVEESLNIVVSTEQFPKVFAAECSDDLENIFHQFQDEKKDERLNQAGINKSEHFTKLLTATMFDYNDQYTCSSFAAAHKEIQNSMEQMAQNIEKMQENIATTEQLKQTSDELLEFAAQFKKQSSTLKYIMWRKTAIISGVIVGGASGAVTGFFIGGPGGAAILGFEAAEVAAGLGIGMLLGRSAAVTCTSPFWKRTFVSVGKKISLKKS